jgi:ribosomal protein L10
VVYKFLKGMEAEKTADLSKLIGGVDLKNKEFIGFEQIKLIGALPSREILLSQLMGAISSPLRALLYVLEERAKKVVTPPPAV